MSLEIESALSSDFFQLTFLQNTMLQYVGAFFIALGFWIIIQIFRRSILKKLKKFTRKTKTIWDDTIAEIIVSLSKFFYFSLTLYLAVYFTSITGIIYKVSFWFFFIFAIIELIKAFHKLIDFCSKELNKHFSKKGVAKDMSIFSTFLKIILWVILLLVILDNLGYEISTLVTGLGIGGIAIALAVQNVLKDLFSSLSIFFDKPFEVGDYVVLGEDSGNIKKVGLKTTRITTLMGDELVIPNDTLTSIRIRNYGKMKKRRVAFTIGVEYGTTAVKLKKIPKFIKEIIEKIKTAEFERCHFKEFADFCLNIETVYYVISGDYKTYMDTQQKINLAIKTAFEKEGISMAFPTQTVFLKKEEAIPV